MNQILHFLDMATNGNIHPALSVTDKHGTRYFDLHEISPEGRYLPNPSVAEAARAFREEQK